MRGLVHIFLLTLAVLHSNLCSAQTVTRVAAGAYHSLFVKSDGSLWGMGRNDSYQLGTGDRTNRYSPVLLVSNVVAVTAGEAHSMFIKTNGSIWGMGANNSAQLGVGSIGGWATTPIQIKNDEITGAAAGWNHSLFLDGTGLWGMGNNVQGQLGIGNYSSTSNYLPERAVFNGVTAVAAGLYHSAFLKTNGSLWTMGENSRGQLGNGMLGDVVPYSGSNQPVLIVASNVVAVAANYYHTLFIKSDGSLWGMGNNSDGQLGIGTFASTNVPILIVASNVTAAAAGSTHSLFIKTDGSLWGMGSYQPLGTNGSYFTTPVCLVSTGVVAIAAGHLHSLFVKSDGSLWGMGGNSVGQVGDGSTGDIIPPKMIVPGAGFNRINGEILSGGNVRLSFQGYPGTQYVLERAFNLWTPAWIPQATNLASAGGLLLFTNTPNPATNNFWRVRYAP